MLTFLLTPTVLNYLIHYIKMNIYLGDTIDAFRENGYDIEKIGKIFDSCLNGETEIDNLTKKIILYAPILNYYGLLLGITNDKKLDYKKYSEIENYSSYELNRLENKKVIKKRVLRKEDNYEQNIDK